MALIKADRVRETTTTTGTGAISLAGAATGYQAFSAVCADGDTCYYAIVSQTGTEWETGLGTFSTPATLTRTTVHSSSNGGSAVSFTAGTKDVFIALTATQFSSLTNVDLTSQVTGVLPLANGGTGQATASAALNALLPSQSGNNGKYLTTNGTSPSWADNPLGTVTSVGGTGTVNGLTLTGTVTTSGNLTLGGTLSGVNLTSQVTGTLPVGNGGTGTTTGSITGTGALTFEAGGTNQSVFINPSGTGAVWVDGVPIRMAGTGYSVSFVQNMSNVSSGSLNVGVGGLAAITTGSYCTSTGYGSLGGVFTSSYSTAIGYEAGYRNSLGNLLNDPANCTYIGAICRGQDNYETNAIVIGYDARGKGSNTTVLGNSSTTQTWLGGGELRLPGSTSGYVGLKGAATAGSVTYTLPSADGTSGQMLSTNGSGDLSWSTVTSNPGTVTSVGGTGTVNGITLTGTVTSSGNLTLGGTLSNVSLTSQVTGTLPIANGGTGQTTAANAINALLPTQTSNSGKFLTTNGTAASWATVAASPAGSSGQVQYNSSGSFAGASRLTILSNGWPKIADTYSNLAIGQNALSSVSGASYNLGIGDGSLQNMGSSGTFNVALGYSSLGALTSGSNNVSIGYESGQEASTSINCVFVGYQAGYGGFPYNGSNSNVIVIGYKAEPSTNSVTHEITLGNSSISTLRCAVTTITSLSDQRDKTNIQPMPSVLSFIASLNPVRFDWWTRDGAKIGVPDYGFIAQELQQAQASTGFDWAQLVYESNPEKLEASPGKLIPILVKAIQELAAKVAALEASA